MDTIYINDPDFQEVDKRTILQPSKTEEGLSVIFSYDSDFGSAKVLRDYMEAICDIVGLENRRKSRLILISDELNNNAIEYGSQPGDRNKMMVVVTKIDTGYEINVEIEDTGNGRSAKHANDMENIRALRLQNGFKDHDSIRGRGLFMIITSLVDELYFRDGSNGGLIVGVRKKI